MPTLHEEMDELHRELRHLLAPLARIVERVVARLDRRRLNE